MKHPNPEFLMYRCNQCQSLCKTDVQIKEKKIIFYCKRCDLEYGYTGVSFP